MILCKNININLKNILSKKNWYPLGSKNLKGSSPKKEILLKKI